MLSCEPGRGRPTVPGLLIWLLRLGAGVYGTAVTVRNVLYDRGWTHIERLPCRVISIGNVTVGGTGKTPLLIDIVDRLMARGLRVGVLSRGYARHRSSGMRLVSDGQRVLEGPRIAGDEPYLIARRCPHAVVAVGSDRARLGRWVLARHALDCLVLDDGFQHRRLHRNLDLILIDASVPNQLQDLLPAGRLREPLPAARRADAVVLTRVEMASQLSSLITTIQRALGVGHPLLQVAFVPAECVNVLTRQAAHPSVLAGSAAVLVSGIGNPCAFRRLAEEFGVEIRDHLRFSDHHWYTAQDVRCVRDAATRAGTELVVTTEKDAVKLAPLLHETDRWLAMRLRAVWHQGESWLEQALTR